MKRLLFLCLGNICRSPAAEEVARVHAARRGLDLQIDSAGLGGWHAGERPDPRMTAAAANRGYDVSGQRARALVAEDFADFDLILTLDAGIHERACALAPDPRRAVVRRLLDFSAQPCGTDVPDPYYGGAAGFETALTLIETAVAGLLDALEKPVV